jgi:hypothetical protein
VQAGETRKLALVLNAGILKLSSNLDTLSDDQQTRIAYTIEYVKPVSPKTIKLSVNGSLVELDQSLPTRSFRNSFVLPEGDYLVHALYGNSNAQATARVQIKAGQEVSYKIRLSAGIVTLSLVLDRDSPPLPGVFWSIFNKAGEQVASASSITPRLTLSKGSYTVVADYLDQSYRRNFVLRNGDNKNIQLKPR